MTPKSQELVPLEQQAVSDILAAVNNDPWADVDDGLINMDAIGITMPLLRPDFRPPGNWTDETTGETRTALDFIWLASMPSRAYYAEAYGKGPVGSAPDCRSANMVSPDDQSPKPQTATCAGCAHSKWNNETGEPPACSVRLNVLVFDLGTQHLARTWFSGTSVSRAKRYLSALRVHVPPRVPMSCVTHAEMEPVERDGKKWAEAVLTVGSYIERSEARPLIELQQANLPAWRAQVTVDTETLVEDDVADAEIVYDKDSEPF